MRWTPDFRATASNQFQILRELCKFSQTTIGNDIQAFYDDELISAYLLSESLLKAELVSVTTVFQTNSVANFLQLLSFVRTFVLGNQLMPAIETAFQLELYTYDGLSWEVATISVEYDGTSDTCSCSSSASCNMWSAFYNKSESELSWYLIWQPSVVSLQVQNWFVACWPLESLLLSSLDNSFLNNQTALDVIATYFNWPLNSTPMALNIPKEINQTVTFNDTLQTLFMENFSTELNYSLYYAECRPRSCLYSVNQHSSFLYIFTALLGLYGGLSVVLRLLIPHVVSSLIRYLNSTPPQLLFVDVVTIRVTWKQRGRAMTKIVRDSLVDLNLFKSSLRQQPSDIKQQRWTTRIYIGLLALALIILTLQGLLSYETKLIQVSNPSFSTVQQLQSQTNLISSLQCSCTQLTIPYGQFIQLQPFYHQVCSSAFVTDDWIIAFDDLITALITIKGYTSFNGYDFAFSQPLFVLLQALCVFSNETITSALQIFQRTPLVGAQLLTVNDFTNQISSVIREFELETTSTFIHFIQLLSNITYVNQIMSASESNFYPAVNGPPNYLPSVTMRTQTTSIGNSSYTCSCANDATCEIQWGLYTDYSTDILMYSIPGFFFGCQLVDSLMQSTLECFYDNQACLDIIINIYNVSTFGNFTRLNSSIIGSRFAINSTIESLVSQMFIESWAQSVNYSSYFTNCQPASCSYTISQRNNLVETITRIISLIGAPCRARLVAIGTKIRDWFKKVNVFDDTNRAVSIEQQCLATRVYILLLIITLIIVVMYTSLTYYLNTFTITNPSLQQYQQLQQRYGLAAVSCSCSRSSIPYSTFIELECDFHPVCKSHFISDSYMQELFELYNDLDTTYASSNAYTLQGTIFTHFQTLLVLCNLAKDFVSDAQQQYLASSVVATGISDVDLFETETNSSLVNFRTTLPNLFLNSLQLIRSLIQGNGLVSAYSTNWYPFTYNIVKFGTIYFKPQYYGSDGCNCATSATCTQPSTPFIQGYLVGCTPLESLLQSTIECLYEQSCVDLLGIYLNMSLPNSTIPLYKNETRFSATDTVDSIVQQMFVETCSSNVSYNQYFEQCKPDSCSVTLFESGSFIIIVTTILGLYGGLTTFLKLVVPFFVFSTYKLFLQQVQARQPAST
ncbi:unnamed protein product [Adineta steineri]|uniref:Uncharacterized protein n=1 Tax=Adineta steineri TaxID=433720 RepID=A0A814H983_9BILA|nr:unnamed protein product [Adineta steineri]